MKTLLGLPALLERKNGLFVTALIALTLALGIVYSFSLGNGLRFLPDEQDYDNLATWLARGGFFSLDGQNPTAYRAPGYPLLLAPLRFFGGEVVHFRILNFLLLGLSMLVAYRLLVEQSLPLAAVLGPLLLASYPVLFFTAGTIYPQILAVLLLLLVLYFYTRTTMQGRDYLCGGLCLGYLVLTIPIFAFALPVFAAWLWLRPGGRRLGWLLASLAAALLLVGVWSARNYAAFGTVLFVTSVSGDNLRRGNAEHTLEQLRRDLTHGGRPGGDLLWGNSATTTPNAGVVEDLTAAECAGLGELELDRCFRDQALEYIRNHPSEVARLYLLKLINFFNFRNSLVSQAQESSFRDLLLLLTYGPLLLLLIARVLLIGRYPLLPFETLLIVLYITSALVSAVFYPRIRYRVPFDPLLILVAATFLDQLLRPLQHAKASSALASDGSVAPTVEWRSSA